VRFAEVSSDANASLSSEPVPPEELLSIARAASAGDSAAAATLLLKLGGGMFRVVQRVYGARHPDLDDIKQETRIAVLAALPYFRGESSVKHFAYRVALMTALGAMRKTRAQMRRAQEEAIPFVDVPDPRGSPYSNAASRERRELILELLNELSEPIAQALGLHIMLDQPVDEIAEALGVSPHTVWSRLRLGKQTLRRKLERNADLRELLEGQE
jgi:RNA polymerase sigma factor (sigma-70 family)